MRSPPISTGTRPVGRPFDRRYVITAPAVTHHAAAPGLRGGRARKLRRGRNGPTDSGGAVASLPSSLSRRRPEWSAHRLARPTRGRVTRSAPVSTPTTCAPPARTRPPSPRRRAGQPPRPGPLATPRQGRMIERITCSQAVLLPGRLIGIAQPAPGAGTAACTGCACPIRQPARWAGW